MDETVTKYKKSLKLRFMASKVQNRKDCLYKTEVIRNILRMYFEECEKVLLDGEKIELPGIGSLNPKVHAPMTYNMRKMNKEEGNAPQTEIKFVRYPKFKIKMNNRYWKNIKAGYAGLGTNCKCTTMQRNLLIDKGFMRVEEDEEGEN